MIHYGFSWLKSQSMLHLKHQFISTIRLQDYLIHTSISCFKNILNNYENILFIIKLKILHMHITKHTNQNSNYIAWRSEPKKDEHKFIYHIHDSMYKFDNTIFPHNIARWITILIMLKILFCFIISFVNISYIQSIYHHYNPLIRQLKYGIYFKTNMYIENHIAFIKFTKIIRLR